MVQGQITKIVVTNQTKGVDPADNSQQPCDTLIYCADPGVTPYPGLIFYNEQAALVTWADIAAQSNTDRYTAATT